MKAILLNSTKLIPFSEYSDINIYLKMHSIKKEDISIFKHLDSNSYIFKHGHKICDQMGYATSHLDSKSESLFNQKFIEVN